MLSIGRKSASFLRSHLTKKLRHQNLLSAPGCDTSFHPVRAFNSRPSIHTPHPAHHAQDAYLYEAQDAENLSEEMKRNYPNTQLPPLDREEYEAYPTERPSLTPDELAIVHRHGLRTVKAFKFGITGEYVECKFDLSRLKSVCPGLNWDLNVSYRSCQSYGTFFI